MIYRIHLIPKHPGQPDVYQQEVGLPEVDQVGLEHLGAQPQAVVLPLGQDQAQDLVVVPVVQGQEPEQAHLQPLMNGAPSLKKR